MRWQVDMGAVPAARDEDAARQHSAVTLEVLRNSPLITVLDGMEDLAEATQTTKRFRHISDRTVVIGTGGASLGAQALVAAASDRERLVFLDNIDPMTVEHVFARFDKTRTSWIIASKSGGTVETLAVTLALIAAYREEGLLPELSGRAAVITQEEDGALASIAKKYALARFVHPAVGGRYSVFTLVGLLPALIAGMDAAKIRQGAIQWFARVLSGERDALTHSVAWLYESRLSQPVHVVMAYADGLRAYTRWFQQLWAESLGKGGQGSTPYAAIGTIDQHSQLQLFLDGPRDKSFTLVLPGHKGRGPVIRSDGVAELMYLDGHRIGDVMDASAEGTVATLAAHGVPLRVLRTGRLDEAAMGELLLMHMVETITVAAMMGVDPYDQPAVEEGKKRTRDILRAKAPASGQQG